MSVVAWAMRFGRATAWLGALAFWIGFAWLLGVGPPVDEWVRAVEWTGLAVLSVLALWAWRPGQLAQLPPRISRWMTDEDSDAETRR